MGTLTPGTVIEIRSIVRPVRRHSRLWRIAVLLAGLLAVGKAPTEQERADMRVYL